MYLKSNSLAEPSIRDAFGLCVQQGANSVIVSPFFLIPGRHWHQDIPSLTAEAAKGHPANTPTYASCVFAESSVFAFLPSICRSCSCFIFGECYVAQISLLPTNKKKQQNDDTPGLRYYTVL
ncbi:hypothetical protein ACSBR2_007373 [Camellia fascicularis]